MLEMGHCDGTSCNGYETQRQMLQNLQHHHQQQQQQQQMQQQVQGQGACMSFASPSKSSAYKVADSGICTAAAMLESCNRAEGSPVSSVSRGSSGAPACREVKTHVFQAAAQTSCSSMSSGSPVNVRFGACSVDISERETSNMTAFTAHGVSATSQPPLVGSVDVHHQDNPSWPLGPAACTGLDSGAAVQSLTELMHLPPGGRQGALPSLAHSCSVPALGVVPARTLAASDGGASCLQGTAAESLAAMSAVYGTSDKHAVFGGTNLSRSRSCIVPHPMHTEVNGMMPPHLSGGGVHDCSYTGRVGAARMSGVLPGPGSYSTGPVAATQHFPMGRSHSMPGPAPMNTHQNLGQPQTASLCQSKALSHLPAEYHADLPAATLLQQQQQQQQQWQQHKMVMGLPPRPSGAGRASLTRSEGGAAIQMCGVTPAPSMPPTTLDAVEQVLATSGGGAESVWMQFELPELQQVDVDELLVL
jgi:hypothetical protein